MKEKPAFLILVVFFIVIIASILWPKKEAQLSHFQAAQIRAQILAIGELADANHNRARRYTDEKYTTLGQIQEVIRKGHGKNIDDLRLENEKQQEEIGRLQININTLQRQIDELRKKVDMKPSVIEKRIYIYPCK